MTRNLNRRQFCGALALGVPMLGAAPTFGAPAAEPANGNKIRLALNFGTILGYDLNLMQELEIARDAGYRSVEIWLNRLADWTKDGDGKPFAANKLAELKKWLDGEGIKVENGIGFATWIVNEEDKRAAGLDELKRQAEALAAIGCPCVAAPAAGPWNEKIEGIKTVAERYAAALDVCAEFGVRALLELWGASPTLYNVADCMAICAETRRPDAALLLDAYHLYRGGNSFAALNLISGTAMPVFHMNDYPAEPEREKLTDADRVFPGDGICPIVDVVRTLIRNGFTGALSLELFNKTYREKMTALEQAKIGLEKMTKILDEALEGAN